MKPFTCAQNAFLLFSLLIASCQQRDQQAQVESVVAPQDSTVVNSNPIEARPTIDQRFIIQNGKLGNLYLGISSINDALKEYPELKSERVSAYEMGHFFAMNAYKFSKDGETKFYLVLKNAVVDQDTISLAEVLSADFQTTNGLKVGETLKQLLMSDSSLKVNQCNFQYFDCELINDRKEGLTYFFKTTLDHRIGTYEGEEDSQTNSVPKRNFDARISKITLSKF